MPRRRLVVLGLILCTLTSIGFAAEKAKTPTAEAVADAPAPAPAGMQIAIDPVTGRLRPPTAEEAKVLSEGLKSILNDSSEGLIETPVPAGGFALDLEGRFQNVFVAFVQPEGDVLHECLSSPAQVDATIAAAAASAGAKE